MTWLFEAVGLEYNKPNRKLVDEVVREAVGLEAPAYCPEAWAAVKALTDDERSALAASVSSHIAGVQEGRAVRPAHAARFVCRSSQGATERGRAGRLLGRYAK